MSKPALAAHAVTSTRMARVKGDIAQPLYLVHLMHHIGPTAAAKLIGTSPGTLHKARNAGAVSRSIEVAARGICQENGYGPVRTDDLRDAVQANSADTALFLVQVPRGMSEIIEKTVSALGGTVRVQV